MPKAPVQNVLLVHGYSVRSLDSWGRLPTMLAKDGISASSIYLSAFVSLDDHVSCDDLAEALERRIATLDLDLTRTAVICHSTGAIIGRRWLLNHRSKGGTMPSHLITAAGANHGSTLAQIGRTELAHVFREVTEQSSVGRRVLEDLDYGSEFLRRLNREWLAAWNAKHPLYEDTFCFSMIGTDHRYWQNQLTWQTHEAGSDGTVRISGGNFNYRLINVKPPYDKFDTITMNQPAPHLIVETDTKRYSHTSQSERDEKGLVASTAVGIVSRIVHFGRPSEPVTNDAFGILEGIEEPNERPYVALREAFDVLDTTAYDALATKWAAETAAWTKDNPDETNATIVVAITDESGRLVDDSLILVTDDNGAIRNVSESVMSHQPIRNALSPSVVSLYVNYKKFHDVNPHGLHAEAQTDTPYVHYGFEVDAPLSDSTSHVIAPNEFTYVEVAVRRDPSESFVFYSFANPGLADLLKANYPPFPKGYP
jgi:hypothetical protein